MSLQQEVDLLKRVPLFARIEPSKLKLLAFTSERLTFQAGQMLMKQGDVGDSAYVILDGKADILIDTPNGPLKIAELSKNAFVGDMAILCDVPRTATVTATEPVTTLKISKDLFFRLVTEFPQMSVEIMRELAHRLEEANHRLRDATVKIKQLGG
jgi:CRP/FNR family transcriptional regulator, cyclic AMP receptor protein